jgi:hypothetical protein
VRSTSPGAQVRDAAARQPACDVCARPRARGERRRLVWHSVGGDLVLADLCARCARESDRILEMFGGHGREAVGLVQEVSPAAVERAPVRRVGGVVVRGLVYVLIALATFFVVTFVTTYR